jgi:hypothetical protein
MFVAAEETCFVLLEADTVESVHDVALIANVQFNQISEVASLPEWDVASPLPQDIEAPAGRLP